MQINNVTRLKYKKQIGTIAQRKLGEVKTPIKIQPQQPGTIVENPIPEIEKIPTSDIQRSANAFYTQQSNYNRGILHI